MRGLALLLALPLALASGPAEAYCRLALALAVDVSSSVDEREYALQAEGLAQALEHPEVVDAFLTVPGGTVALMVYEWSGRYQQDVVLSWREITRPDDLTRAAAALRGTRRTYAEFPTSIGYALGFGAVQFRDAPRCDRQVIDVSGDGINNDGFPPELAIAEFDFENTVVNGLVVGPEPGLEAYYWAEVIHGPDAFVEVAARFEDFGAAMKRKLIKELGVAQLGAR
ncbi:MAG: DUF1194 domain-containing protein [Pseudomonadota bacterium]